MNHDSAQSYDISALIERGEACLGFELGSTRIKGTLIGPDYRPLASGSYGWENKFENGVWTYDLQDVWTGVAACYSDLASDVKKLYGVQLNTFAAGGFSAMMHGYIALDAEGKLLVPFRTWRNNITEEATIELTKLFNYPIPQRWSIAHLYQSILNGEDHVRQVAYITTLAGYVHWKLTGEKVIGIGDASGMFPINPDSQDFDAEMIEKFDIEAAKYNFSWKLRDILPKIIPVGDAAGTITAEGAKLLDNTGKLPAGIPLCPPEGDSSTGMVATNSILPRTGNVSAGTSVFAMVVLEKKLSKVHSEIDIVVTPDGKPVAMAHSNNCTSDFDAWMSLFAEAAGALGQKVSQGDVFGALMPTALKGDADAGGLLSYGYVSGEHVTGFSEGRPLFVRRPDDAFNLANFLRSHLFSSLCAMRTGLNVLMNEENVRIEEIRGHGGFFKTQDVGQKIMAAATKAPCRVLDTAGEGGAWGMALLAAFMARENKAVDLPGYLEKAFAESMGNAVDPDPKDVEGFEDYFKRYTKGLAIERAAVDNLK